MASSSALDHVAIPTSSSDIVAAVVAAAAKITSPSQAPAAPTLTSKISSSTTQSLAQSSSSQTRDDKPFWLFTTAEIERWVRQLAPGVPNTGGMLFPVRTNIPAVGDTSVPNMMCPDSNDEEALSRQTIVGNTLLLNLTRALNAASSSSSLSSSQQTIREANVVHTHVEVEPDAKRVKIEHNDNGIISEGGVLSGDIYQILDPSFAKTSTSDGPSYNGTTDLCTGSILSRITLGGLVNALAGVPGGIVDTITGIPLSELSLNDNIINNDNNNNDAMKTKHLDVTLNTAGCLTLREVINFARGLHRSIAARTEVDILATTPRRIADLLCPEISDSELKTIRRRVYDTVVLGLGTNASANAASLEKEDSEILVASKRETEIFQKCSTCGNNDQASFILDRKNGDLICTNCGTVVSESIMHEGSQYRKFEGEEDKNHHGDAPNPLFSNSHNMATTLGGVSFQTGAGMGGYGTGSRGGIENILRNAHAYTEMNISQFGKEEKKTRIGYKDRQKKDAFYQMVHAGDALGLHEAVVQRAKELFAGFRDDRELVQQFKGVIAACLSEAFDQLSRDGKQLLKKFAGEAFEENEDSAAVIQHARASRRNDLHSASLAGKGGLLLDTTVVSHSCARGVPMHEKSTMEALTGQPFESKAAASWDIDDCKSWMIEATKSIARSWIEAQQMSSSVDLPAEHKQAHMISVGAIPKGTKDELEGTLVDHALKVCDYLEFELDQSSDVGSKSLIGDRRIHTPRVADMGTLGIKWQHSYERGSGGKGGVGNSGRTIIGVKPGEKSTRSAGQILLLLTAKKFGKIIGDEIAGAAFHKELKAVIGREEAKQRLDRREEATQARLNQMKRKPWLQKRIQL